MIKSLEGGKFMPVRVRYSDELYHHGIKGQKWGIRRYQNPDGSLTPEGLKRYGRSGKRHVDEKTISKINKIYDSNLPAKKKYKKILSAIGIDETAIDDIKQRYNNNLEVRDKAISEAYTIGKRIYQDKDFLKDSKPIVIAANFTGSDKNELKELINEMTIDDIGPGSDLTITPLSYYAYKHNLQGHYSDLYDTAYSAQSSYKKCIEEINQRLSDLGVNEGKSVIVKDYAPNGSKLTIGHFLTDLIRESRTDTMNWEGLDYLVELGGLNYEGTFSNLKKAEETVKKLYR
jgi:hypothetical protein